MSDEVPLFADPIADRAFRIRRRIQEACERAGRSADEVTLVAASKSQPIEALESAWQAGVRVFGENRVQEALRKRAALPAEAEWHLIGPLQSNKVKAALELFRTFHAIDRVRIARALDTEAGRRGLRIEGFLEVNLGDEPTKHGFAPEELAREARALAGYRNLRLVGLMAIPPPAEDAETARGWFRQLRRLRDELAARPEWAGFPGRLSMGMSDDFEIAIEEGATHVRVGTALFGPRG